MHPIPVPAHFRIIAHRGASAYVPENSLAAFKLAHDMGVTEVELDTQLSSDGVVVICHDATLERYGHGTRVVESLPWSTLSELDMGSWFSPHLFAGTRMLTLDDLFAAFGPAFTYHVELKGKAPGLPASVHAAIRAYDLMESVIITSFNYDMLVAMQQVNPSARLGWLVRRIDADVIAKARALSLYQLCPFAGTVSADQVALARSVATEVRAWGVQGQTVAGQSAEVIELIHRVIDSGCDGMTINWPDWVVHQS